MNKSVIETSVRSTRIDAREPKPRVRPRTKLRAGSWNARDF